uniref:Uncharacterized protein n=2 Tax=Timema TaxID=61471 RepID=A0A7R9FPE8_9NEOP|nr:unnamed protein product [Timema tahoe]
MKYTCICTEGDWKTTLCTPRTRLNTVSGSLALVYCESDALDHVSSEAGITTSFLQNTFNTSSILVGKEIKIPLDTKRMARGTTLVCRAFNALTRSRPVLRAVLYSYSKSESVMDVWRSGYYELSLIPQLSTTREWFYVAGSTATI